VARARIARPAKKDTQAKPGDTQQKVAGKNTKLELKAASDTVKIKQGEEKTVDLTITRGEDLKKDTELTIDAPKGKGIEVEVKASVAPDKKTTPLVIKAGKTAEVGSHKITVSATSSGASGTATAPIIVTVEAGKEETPPAKKDVKLEITGPDAAVTVKQDAKADATVKLTLGKDLEGADLKVAVTGKDDKAVADKDIKVTAPAKVDKSGDAKVTITVGADAAPGDYVATITATSEGAKAASAKINIKVEKK
jgi:methionine-rich copper-binding protein CopC